MEQAGAGLEVAKAQLGQAETQVQSAQAQAQQAEAQLSLLRAGLLAEDIAIAEAQVAQTEAGLKQANIALQDATLTAPLRGVVAQINSQVNELVTLGQPTLILVDDSKYHLTVSVDEADISQISEQQKVEVTLDAYPGESMEGQVVRIAPVSNTEGGVVAYQVRVDLVSGVIPMREGLTANATIVTKRMEDVLVIPNEAILIDDESGHKFAAKLVGEQVQLVPIETGYQTDLISQVSSGLSEGDTVVLRGSSYRERFRSIMSSFGKSTFGSQ
jgi:HlyD family secretion protein